MLLNKIITKILIWSLYFKTSFYCLLKKSYSSGTLTVKCGCIIKEGGKIELINNGTLHIGRTMFARRYFNIIIDGGTCTVGDNCFFNQNCCISCLNSITIEDKCSFGNNLVIVDHDHDFNNYGEFLLGDVFIGENTWVGANVVILRNTHIGKNCVIAAGSVVKGYVPDNTVLVQKRNSVINYR